MRWRTKKRIGLKLPRKLFRDQFLSIRLRLLRSVLILRLARKVNQVLQILLPLDKNLSNRIPARSIVRIFCRPRNQKFSSRLNSFAMETKFKSLMATGRFTEERFWRSPEMLGMNRNRQ